MIQRTSKQCLIIGRTDLDLQQCIDLNHPTHPPAPSTFIWNDYENFDGDIITVHTLKYGAIAACALERSPRTQQEIVKHPGKVVIATSHYHRHYHFTPEEQAAGVFMFNGEYDKLLPNPAPPINNYPTNGQSGMFTLWFALHMGYEKVFTVGLDIQTIQFPKGMNYDKTIAQEFMTAHVKKKRPVNGAASLSLQPGKSRCLAAALETINNFPDQQVFKVSDASLLPCDIAEPPTKGVK